ncbi:MAG: CPBP family intramembrane metalloprotease [Gemmatimonadetes bacterium]|nr:CPBP family intramembrane metalloprotease [Gemmatimonadota bacterium]
MTPDSPRATRTLALPVFFAVAFAVSWLGTVPMVWASYAGAAAVPAPLRALQLLMLLGPGLVALAFAWREGGRAGAVALLRTLLRWRVAPAWYAAALLGPAVLYASGIAVARFAGAPKAVFPPLDALLAAFAGSFGAYLVLNTEELAWRGYAWPRLAARFGPLRAALLLGAVWAVFHLPLFLLKGGHPAGYPPALFGVLLLAFGVLFALAYEGSGGSVLIAHLLHQSLNAWGDALPVYPRATDSLVPIAVVTVLSLALAATGARWLGWRWGAVPDRAVA